MRCVYAGVGFFLHTEDGAQSTSGVRGAAYAKNSYEYPKEKRKTPTLYVAYTLTHVPTIRPMTPVSRRRTMYDVRH